MIGDEQTQINCSVTYAASRAFSDAVNEARLTVSMQDYAGQVVPEDSEDLIGEWRVQAWDGFMDVGLGSGGVVTNTQ